jgi:hypothetical protein
MPAMKQQRTKGLRIRFLLAAIVLMAAAGTGPGIGLGASALVPASADLKPGEIAISGALNVTFTPQRVEAGRLASKIVLNLHEKIWGGVWFRFPADTKPGTYVIEDQVAKPGAGILAGYDAFGASRGFYLGTGGTLVLTEVGAKFSGRFEFTAVLKTDHAKTIKVIGTFAGVPFVPD